MRSIYTLIFCALSYISMAGSFIEDSVAIETKGESDFIIHKVEEGETLYSLSRRYNVPIYEIIKNNPPTEFGLDPGQTIKIPIIKKKPLVAEYKPEIVEEDIPESTNEKSIEEPKKTTLLQPEVKTTSEVIEHTVEEKQTLFAISRLYDVSVTDIMKWNELTSNDLSIGQVLKIYRGKLDEQSIEQIETPTNSELKTHIVKPSETLYSISKLYALTIPDIKKWNNLTSNEISIGQELIIQAPEKIKDTLKVEPVVVDVIVEKDSNVVTDVPEVLDTAKYKIKPERKQLYNEIFESGLAEQIEGSSNNRKYLALHKTAGVGTIIKVRNEMNDQEVFVRVIGTLPDTSVNNNVVIKLSKSAYERLGAIDPKFRVSISYIP